MICGLWTRKAQGRRRKSCRGAAAADWEPEADPAARARSASCTRGGDAPNLSDAATRSRVGSTWNKRVNGTRGSSPRLAGYAQRYTAFSSAIPRGGDRDSRARRFRCEEEQTKRGVSRLRCERQRPNGCGSNAVSPKVVASNALPEPHQELSRRDARMKAKRYDSCRTRVVQSPVARCPQGRQVVFELAHVWCEAQ